MVLRTCSQARPLAKMPNVLAKGTLPLRASPAATPIMFASAMPMSKKRPGNFSAKSLVRVDFDRSASSTTISGCVSPSSASALP